MLHLTTPSELLERCSVPGEALGATRLFVTGTGLALVENHRGILDYSEGFLSLAAGRGRLLLFGNALRLRAMDQGELLVTGQLQSAQWE